MTVVLDHTIVPVKDQDEAAEWYCQVLGFENMGKVGPFSAVRVNETLVLDFRTSEDLPSIHYAFAMDMEEFEGAFQRIREAGIPYGDSPFDIENMQGPGTTTGAKGPGKAVYFRDPSSHVLEIKAY